MKNLSKALCCALVFATLVGCKKTADDTTESAASADTASVSSSSAGTMGEEDQSTATSGSLRQYQKPTRELTQHEIDSIKAERDKIVTPPQNTGASATPGSGRAVPGNNKAVSGNNANEGSSTGDVEE